MHINSLRIDITLVMIRGSRTEVGLEDLATMVYTCILHNTFKKNKFMYEVNM